MVNARIRRNLGSVRSLMTSHKSVRGRIADLGLSDKALESRLFAYFEKYDVQEPESWTDLCQNIASGLYHTITAEM